MRAIVPTSANLDDLDELENGFDPPGRDSAIPRSEILRPLRCQLTIRDYTLLESHMLDAASRKIPADRPLIRLIRTKLADARIVLSDDIAPDVATGNSRIVYAIDGAARQSGVLRHWQHGADEGSALAVRSLLGVTLLGLRAGERAPLLRGDGSLGEVCLMEVAFQPEAARRIAALTSVIADTRG